MSQSPLIILSAGGTGGHMTPAQALGHDLLSRGFRVELVTDLRGQKYEPMFKGIPMHVIPSGTLGAGMWGKVNGVANLGFGIFKANRLIKKIKPSLVAGFGGYPSIPAVYAAQRLNIPTIIHQSDAIIGQANAYLAPKATRIAVSWADTRGMDENEKERVIVTGNPVRAEIAALYMQPYPNMTDGALRIFIMGGSLGAKVFSEVVPKAFAMLSAEYRSKLQIVQQCRAEQIEETRAAYKAAGIKAELASFFDNVSDQLAQAHLVISRSGASTVAEVTTAGRPAIFVPYPHHKDQQQKINSDAVADAGGAWTMTEEGFTAEALLARIETFLQNPSILFKAAEKSRSCGKPDAARKLGNLVTEIISGWK